VSHFKRKFTLWAAALCLLLTPAIAPVLTRAQTSPSDTSNAGTTKKAKKRVKKDKAAAGEKAAAPDSSTNASKGGPGSSPSPSALPNTVPDKSSSKTARTSANNTADPEIAAAKASGKVWVNLSSGVYHMEGRWYGKTKNGMFMTEAEAKAAGYKGSQRD
jgi:hypothetical protein